MGFAMYGLWEYGGGRGEKEGLDMMRIVEKGEGELGEGKVW